MLRVKTRNVNNIKLDGEAINEVEDFTYLGNHTSKESGSDRDILARIGKERTAFAIHEACMEIKGDTQKDQVKEIQHQMKVCPPKWFKDTGNNQRNVQKTAVLCQQIPEVRHGHPLARGHKEQRTVGKELNRRESTPR